MFNYPQAIQRIEESDDANDDVKKSLRLLKADIRNALIVMPADLEKEFDRSVTNRLSTLQESLSEYIIADYRSTLLSIRILELAGHTFTMQFRDIGNDLETRNKAKQQYASILAHFEKVATESEPPLDDSMLTIVGGPVRQTLRNVQEDAFRPGYGQPLTEQETMQLTEIINDLLQRAFSFSEDLEPDDVMGRHHREASRIAWDDWQRLLRFLRDRENNWRDNALFVHLHKQWRHNRESFRKTVWSKNANAEQLEQKAIVERTERMIEQHKAEDALKRVTNQVSG